MVMCFVIFIGCQYSECFYADCHFILLNDIAMYGSMHNAIMLLIVMLNAIITSFILSNAIMLLAIMLFMMTDPKGLCKPMA
jgi:hypothetical protein